MNATKILVIAYLICQLLIVALLFQAKSMLGQDKHQRAVAAAASHKSSKLEDHSQD